MNLAYQSSWLVVLAATFAACGSPSQTTEPEPTSTAETTTAVAPDTTTTPTSTTGTPTERTTTDHPPPTESDASTDGSDASGTTAEPAPWLEIDPFEFVPATIYSGALPCIDPLGHDQLFGTLADIDDCRECLCSTYGLTCRRRSDCDRDVCVFIDGTEIMRGGTAPVADCFQCTCNGEGSVPEGACTRRTDGPCPDDGCSGPLVEFLAPGDELFLGECHMCTCDLETGLLCKNACHDGCLCEPGYMFDGCQILCDGDYGCEAYLPHESTPDLHRLEIPNLALATTEHARCICDYASLHCTANE